MSSLLKYPSSFSQTSGGSFRTFSNLSNIGNGDDSAATSSGNIKGKSSSPNRPSTVTCTGFNFNLPTGAEISKVSVTISHRKNKVGSNVCNIPAPTLSFVGVSGVESRKTFAPSLSYEKKTYNFFSKKFTRSIVNSSSFGVKLDYPTNTNEHDGTVSILYVNVRVYYKAPSYSLSLKKVSGGYDGEDYTIEATISNKTLTSYNPSLTLSAPAGFAFKSSTGKGTVTKVNNRTLSWNPGFNSKTGSSTISCVFSTDVTFPGGSDTYTGTFSLVESLHSTTKTHTATITKAPVISDDSSDEPILPDGGTGTVDEMTQINVIANNDFILDLNEIIEPYLEDAYQISIGFVDGDPDTSYDGSYNSKTSGTSYTIFWYHFREANLPINGNWTISEPSMYLSRIKIVDSNNEELFWMPFYVNVIPEESDLSTPYYTLMEVTGEELNRLGTGIEYVCQADLKNTTTDTNPRNWYKNYRIGIFNNNIENVDDYTSLTDSQIIDNALYWASNIAGLNEYSSVECEFTYNEDYPLYVIITGDYPEASTLGFNIGNVTFDEPTIIEKSIYDGRLGTGNYPNPILDLINYEQSEDSATIILGGHSDSTPIRVYNFPVDEDFGTNTTIAIRGIQVRANIESADQQIIYARLINPDGESGQRSLVLDAVDTTIDSSNELVIGGLGDLWGFTTVQMTNLKDWQVELTTSNILSNTESTLNFSDIEIVFYFETITHQEITVKIEGEDLAYYGAFLENINIPEGLNTNTSYLSIDGTDNNDAYRQNIKEKTITLEFNIGECDLQTSTDMLRQLTALLVNEKDEYNRPIPNRITFSNYPDDYFEYIMEEALQVNNEIGTYNVTAKLVIPAGTSYTNDEIVTNTVGTVHGLAAINPIITLQPSDENIEVQETITGQTFSMGYSGDWNTRVVVIDCEDRKVYLREDEESEDQTDISKYVDFNVDWFRLHGEYQFEGINCTIRTVSYNERW